MEYRRFANVASSKYLGHDTKLVPQLEDYDLFRSGICDPFAPIGPFRLVLNVIGVEPEELKLTFPEGNILQVTARHLGRKTGGLSYARDCTIKYLLPDEVNSDNLQATWHADQYLVIHEKTVSENATGVSGTECPVSQSTVERQGSSPKNGEHSKSTVELEGQDSSPKDGENSESGPKDGDDSESGPKDDDSESGPKDDDSESGAKDGEYSEITVELEGQDSSTKDGEDSGYGPKDSEYSESTVELEGQDSSTKDGEDSEYGAKDSEYSESTVELEGHDSSSKDVEDSESGRKDGEDSESGSNNHEESESGPKKDVKILKPVESNQKFKPFIDVDELRDLFAGIADEASIDEKYILDYFFTAPNVTSVKSKSLEYPSTWAMLFDMESSTVF